MSHTGGYHSSSDSNCEREREKLARMDESETRERTRERLGTILRQQYGASSAKVNCYSRESRKQYQRLVSDESSERSRAAEWIPPRATRQFRGGITGTAVPFNASELSLGKCRNVGSSPAVSRKCTEDSRRLRRKEPRALLRFIPRVFSPQSSAWLPVPYYHPNQLVHFSTNPSSFVYPYSLRTRSAASSLKLHACMVHTNGSLARIPSFQPRKPLHIHASLYINDQSSKQHRFWLSLPLALPFSRTLLMVLLYRLVFVMSSFVFSDIPRMLIFLFVQLNETQFPGGTWDGCHTFRSTPASVVRDPTKLSRNSIAVICPL